MCQDHEKVPFVTKGPLAQFPVFDHTEQSHLVPNPGITGYSTSPPLAHTAPTHGSPGFTVPCVSICVGTSTDGTGFHINFAVESTGSFAHNSVSGTTPADVFT